MAEVDWEALCHAYGSASDVPVLLSAVTVGDDRHSFLLALRSVCHG
jgi:hypothetical protein